MPILLFKIMDEFRYHDMQSHLSSKTVAKKAVSLDLNSIPKQKFSVTAETNKSCKKNISEFESRLIPTVCLHDIKILRDTTKIKLPGLLSR